MDISIKEISLSIAMGALPAFIVNHFYGIADLKLFVNGAVLPKYLFYYFFTVFVFHLLLCVGYWLYGWHIDKDKRERIRQIIIYVGEVGDGLLGIYRLASGLLLAIPIIWKISEPQTLSGLQCTGLLGVSILFQVGVIAISSINALAKSKL